MSVEASRTDAGTTVTQVVGNPVITDRANKVVTDQFTVTRIPGSITINPKELTLKSATLTKEYDGEPLTNGETGLEAESGWVSGEGATYTFGASQTIVGTTTNTFNIVPNEGTKLSNYDIHKTEGSLKVTNRDAAYAVTITARSRNNLVYDGSEIVVDTFIGQESRNDRIPVEASNGKTYYVADAVAYGSRTDAGTTTVEVSGTPAVYDAATGGNNVSEQFAVTMEPGVITINPSPITITCNDIEKKYTGMAVVPTMDDVTISNGFIGEDGIASITFSGSRTEVGTSPYEITEWTFKEGTDRNNYDVTTTGANITVIENDDLLDSTTIYAKSGGGTYNGQQQSVSGWQYAVNDLIEFNYNGLKYYVDVATYRLAQPESMYPIARKPPTVDPIASWIPRVP